MDLTESDLPALVGDGSFGAKRPASKEPSPSPDAKKPHPDVQMHPESQTVPYQDKVSYDLDNISLANFSFKSLQLSKSEMATSRSEWSTMIAHLKVQSPSPELNVYFNRNCHRCPRNTSLVWFSIPTIYLWLSSKCLWRWLVE